MSNLHFLLLALDTGMHQKNNINNSKKMTVGVGIDFGTSNSTAAIFDGTQVTMIPLESIDSEITRSDVELPIDGCQKTKFHGCQKTKFTMPSAMYIDRDYQTATGQQAVNYYIESNLGRSVELSAQVLGEARTTTGQTNEQGEPSLSSTSMLYGQAFNDAGMEGRLFLGTKRLLNSEYTDRVTIFKKAFKLEALLTPILLRIRQSIEKVLKKALSEGKPLAVDYACIGHPVNFEGDQADNALALSRLERAYQYSGIKTQTRCPEPIAASLSYLYGLSHISDENILTVDFGGGTLDLCILQKKGTHFDILAVHGTGLGGDHIDQRLFKELIFPLLGKGERWVRRTADDIVDTLFPFSNYEELLLNWAVTYTLNQNKYTAQINSCIEQGGEAAIKFRRLLDLIHYNYSYLVFKTIKEFKAELSDKHVAILDIPELDINITLSRKEFENIIAKELSVFETTVIDTLKIASLQSSAIHRVICTGGTSFIPAVKNKLDYHFPNKLIQHDPLTSVASGLAIASFYNNKT